MNPEAYHAYNIANTPSYVNVNAHKQTGALDRRAKMTYGWRCEAHFEPRRAKSCCYRRRERKTWRMKAWLLTITANIWAESHSDKDARVLIQHQYGPNGVGGILLYNRCLMSDVSVGLLYFSDVLLRVMCADKETFSMTIPRCEKPATARIAEEDEVGLWLFERSEGDTCGFEWLPTEIDIRSVIIGMTTSVLGGLLQLPPRSILRFSYTGGRMSVEVLWWETIKALLCSSHEATIFKDCPVL